jgi:two-component system chemotaxis response regulator CheY
MELGNIFLGHMDGKFEELGFDGTISPPQRGGETPPREAWCAEPTRVRLGSFQGGVEIVMYHLESTEDCTLEEKKNAKFLLVDDSPITRQGLRKILEAAGFEIAGEAGDGVQAIKMYHELKPDVVTLDLIMPSMGGIEALRALKQFDPGARVIMVSAMTSRKKVLEAAQHGASHYIIKPFEAEKVLEVANAILCD